MHRVSSWISSSTLLHADLFGVAHGGAVVSMDIVNGLILATYATMAIPTMISALYLSPKVNQAANIYFSGLRNKD